LTALYTVLVEGDDLEDPISDSVRSILDGHIVLSRKIAQRGRYPAVDITQSVSRLAASIVSEPENSLINEVTRVLATYETSRDLIEVGAYKAGTHSEIDRAIRLSPSIEQFLAQRPTEIERRNVAMERLQRLIREPARSA